MFNYQGFRKCNLILVFDAYRVEGHEEEIIPYHNIHVVYTKEAETADSFIERTAHQIGRKYQVTVATSDGLEQVIIRGQGCAMMSARELKEEIERINQEIRRDYVEQNICRKYGWARRSSDPISRRNKKRYRNGKKYRYEGSVRWKTIHVQ